VPVHGYTNIVRSILAAAPAMNGTPLQKSGPGARHHPRIRSPNHERSTRETKMVQAIQRYVGGGVLRKEDPRLLTGGSVRR